MSKNDTRATTPDATNKQLPLKPEWGGRNLPPQSDPETVCVHQGDDPQRHFGAAAPPIYQTSTFIYPDAAAFEKRRTIEAARYEYTRGGNPTNQILEAKIARLEKAEWADCFGSGMAAITAAINGHIEANTHVVAIARCYGPTRAYLEHVRRFTVETTFVNSVDSADFIGAIRPNTRIIYLESPTSGRFEVFEIEPITKVARERGIITIFDNSWASPYFQNPLELGVDLVVHSATKYLNGHSDIVAGAVAGRDPKLRERLWRECELGGGILDPHAAWLMLRGLRTLPLRMERHQQSALAVARMLEQHPKVACVLHPGLESHPQHEAARKQLRGYSGLFSFALKEQNRQAMHRFFDRLQLFSLGVSWGGFESLIVGGTFFNVAGEKPEWLIRLSIGLESEQDLIADLRQALED
ncbi:MAG: PLP-dependent aspartate aminotransferase family protein [Planctomycetes bacterium]|nr:PLP-dependent aspartate aminotransferase family protein [Planctomycetota bacterium]